MENDGSDNKSEKFTTEQDTSETEGDVELSATLCSQRSLNNVLATVGNILEVSWLLLPDANEMTVINNRSINSTHWNIFHNQLWTPNWCQCFDFALYGFFEPESGFTLHLYAQIIHTTVNYLPIVCYTHAHIIILTFFYLRRIKHAHTLWWLVACAPVFLWKTTLKFSPLTCV